MILLKYHSDNIKDSISAHASSCLRKYNSLIQILRTTSNLSKCLNCLIGIFITKCNEFIENNRTLCEERIIIVLFCHNSYNEVVFLVTLQINHNKNFVIAMDFKNYTSAKSRIISKLQQPIFYQCPVPFLKISAIIIDYSS